MFWLHSLNTMTYSSSCEKLNSFIARMCRHSCFIFLKFETTIDAQGLYYLCVKLLSWIGVCLFFSTIHGFWTWNVFRRDCLLSVSSRGRGGHNLCRIEEVQVTNISNWMRNKIGLLSALRVWWIENIYLVRSTSMFNLGECIWWIYIWKRDRRLP